MILITNALVIDPHNNREGAFDILVNGKSIEAVEAPGVIPSSKAKSVIDAKGGWVIPGLIDMHVHLREPGFEWKETIETGAQSAALGGFTTICCMPNTRPTNDCAEITKFILEKAHAANAARVLPIGSVSLKLEGKEFAPLSELREAGCVAFSDDGEPVWNAGMMRRALEWAAMLGVPVCCHEEDKTLSCGGCMNESPRSLRLGLKGWPKVAEEVMIARDIELARTTGGRVHFCHVSSARGAELIRRAKEDGIQVTAEVTPHHLMLTEECVEGYNTNAKMSPPLRSQEDCEALQKALNDGVIDVIASDHAPHEKDSKEVEFDKASNGIIGFPTSLPLTLELVRRGALSKKRAVEALSTSSAKILGLKDLGNLKPGSRADIAIVQPNVTWTVDAAGIKSKSKNTPFLGHELRGAATEVMVEGQLVVRNRTLVQP